MQEIVDVGIFIVQLKMSNLKFWEYTIIILKEK